LVESYRKDGHIHHHTIIGFGKLDELPGVDQKKQPLTRPRLSVAVTRTTTHGR